MSSLADEHSRGSRWAQHAAPILASRLTATDLTVALDHEDLHVRHAVARAVVRRPLTAESLDAALAQRDPLTAMIVARAHLADGSIGDATLRRLVNSRFAGLAAEAAFVLIRSSPTSADSVTEFLLDRRRPVRTVAQYEGR